MAASSSFWDKSKAANSCLDADVVPTASYKDDSSSAAATLWSKPAQDSCIESNEFWFLFVRLMLHPAVYVYVRIIHITVSIWNYVHISALLHLRAN